MMLYLGEEKKSQIENVPCTNPIGILFASAVPFSSAAGGVTCQVKMSLVLLTTT